MVDRTQDPALVAIDHRGFIISKYSLTASNLGARPVPAISRC
ncbi:hypothetical protein DFAR_1560012 [Desulfarculales bacterium]